jgi:hypothetical protein
MDHVILLHFGESVTEQFELVGMRHQVLTFQNRPFSMIWLLELGQS